MKPVVAVSDWPIFLPLRPLIFTTIISPLTDFDNSLTDVTVLTGRSHLQYYSWTYLPPPPFVVKPIVVLPLVHNIHRLRLPV